MFSEIKINVLFTVLLSYLTISDSIFDFLFPKCLCDCGIARQVRILGGLPIENQFPWIVQITTPGKIISGTLINDRYVLTSASLLIGLTPFDVKVTLGLHDRCSPEVHTTNFSVNSIAIHENYGTTNKINDLALIRLNTDGNVGKYPSVCLEGFSNYDEVGIVLGWNNNGIGSNLRYCKRLKLKLPTLTFHECFQTAPKREYFTSDKGCVGVIGAVSGVCKNDAGGGVMTKNKHGKYELIGVLSDENVCGNPPSTAMYTKITPHLTWIKENTKDACYCSN